MNEWGIPNWRDAAAYGETNRWTFDRWRWEFYRRRDDLREYFDARADESFHHWQQYIGKPGFPVAHLRPDEPGFCAIVDLEARAIFGYSGLPNPRIGEQPTGAISPWATDGAVGYIDGDFCGTFGEVLTTLGVTLTDEQASLLSHHLACLAVKLESHEIAVTFDLKRPLEPQLANARKVLKHEQTDVYGRSLEKRRHPARWFKYLRALDAREALATWAEITDTFFVEGLLDRQKNPSGGYRAPPPQAARDMWEAANALRFNF